MKNEIEPVQAGPGTDITAPHYLKDNPHWPLLNGKQKRFVILWYNAYESGMTNAEIYRRAYRRPELSATAASSKALRTTKSLKVAACMRFIDQHLLNETQISINALVQMDIEAAMFDPRDALDDEGKYLPLHKMPRHVARMIKKSYCKENVRNGTVTWHYEWKDGEPARTRLSKHAGYGNESVVNLKGGLDNTIEHTVDPAARARDMAKRILSNDE